MIEEIRAKLLAEVEALNYELHVTLPDTIGKALEHGDLRENADFQAAIERQGAAAARLEHIRSRLHKLSDIDLSKLPEDRVALGSKLTVVDLETKEEEEYEVVIPDAVDVMEGCISVASPLGLAFMDRKEKDVVTVRLPVGVRKLRIKKLRTLHDLAKEQLKKLETAS
jgi:transcription elongation factor GreA